MAPVDREVAGLFNSVQRSAAATERCAKQLWRIVQQSPEDAFQALSSCVELVLAAGQKAPPVERCVRFLGALAAHAPATEEGAAFTEALMQKLCSHLDAVDRPVRFRTAQALACVLHALPACAAIDESLAESLGERLRDRLRDKGSDVRLCAARALGRLPAADEDGGYAGDPVTAALVERLGWEKSKDVRAALLHALPIAPETLPVLLERMRDVAPTVRRASIARLFGLPPSALSIAQRAALISGGLRDRDPSVRGAAEEGLGWWLAEGCGGQVLALLELLDVESYAAEATLAIEHLLSSGALDPSALAETAAGAPGGLRCAADAAAAGDKAGALIPPAAALMWRCVCEWLQKAAVSEGLAAAATSGAAAAMRAAAASRRHEALEMALPEGAGAAVALLLAHAAGGPRHRFAATQLTVIAATCLDWADAASREAAADALRTMIAVDPRADAAAGDACDDADGPEGLPLFGNGGDGAYEEALVRLAAAVHAGGPQELAGALLEAVASLAEKSGLLQTPDDYGLPSPDCRAVREGEMVAAEGANGAEPSQWLQVLRYCSLTLRALPSRRPGARAWDVPAPAPLGLEGVWEALLMPAVRHEAPEVRREAFECVALHCLARPTPAAVPAAALLLRRALTVPDETPAVKAAAARALPDLFLTLGPAAVEPALAANAAVDSSGGGDGRGVVQLLVGAARAVLDEAERAAARPAGTARTSSASSGATGLSDSEVDLLASCGEGLAKLLLHSRAWLRAAAAAAPAPGTAADACPSAASDVLPRALSLLLLLHFHPATEAAARLRQCLSVFFEVFVAVPGPVAAARHRRLLADAALPAARAAHALGGGRASAAKQPAPMILRFVLQLLSSGDAATTAAAASTADASTTAPGDWGAAVLAQQALTEAEHVWLVLLSQGVAPARNRPYAVALVELAAGLRLAPASNGLGLLLAMAQRFEEMSASDAALSKALAALMTRLGALEAAAAPAPSGEELESVVSRLRGLCVSMEPGLAGTESGTTTSASAPGTARKAARGAAAAAAAAFPAPRRSERISGSSAGAAGVPAAALATPQQAPAGREAGAGEGEGEASEASVGQAPPPDWVGRRRGGGSVNLMASPAAASDGTDVWRTPEDRLESTTPSDAAATGVQETSASAEVAESCGGRRPLGLSSGAAANISPLPPGVAARRGSGKALGGARRVASTSLTPGGFDDV